MTEHRYGFLADDVAALHSGPCSVDASHARATHLCHGEFLCLRCLEDHARDVRAAGGTMTYAGNLRPDRDEEETDGSAE